MYDEETKKFNFYYSLECINNAGKVMELTNDRLAFLSIGVCISIYIKENGKDVKDGKSFSITTIDDFIPINDNEIASILAQESEITFWDLTKREKQERTKKKRKDKMQEIINKKYALTGATPTQEYEHMEADIEYVKEGGYYLIRYEKGFIRAWGAIKR